MEKILIVKFESCVDKVKIKIAGKPSDIKKFLSRKELPALVRKGMLDEVEFALTHPESI